MRYGLLRVAGPVCLGLLLLSFQPLPASQDTVVERRTIDPHSVTLASSEIEIDGVLDETAWEAALRLELTYETRPGENIEPPARTECFFTYDDATLYVGCRAYDPEPEKIRARYSDRDRAFQDDFIGVVLDTFNDERRAFEFFVNPLGVQMDLIMDDVGGNEDSSWDAIWNSAGRVTEAGYEVEMAIPFSSLRFQRGSGAQTWGLDIVRMYPRSHRVRIGLNAMDRGIDCYLCQGSKIRGFVGAEPGRNLEITPTLTATRTDDVGGFPNGGLESGDEDVEPGLTVKWGMTPNLTLNGTVNPDFSQVEADVARLDINESFALFFPEKRPFFLEGADFFDTPLNIVHTRSVADPSWGTKLTGKEGANAFGTFVTRDNRTNLLFPGSQGSSIGELSDQNLSGVFRYRRDIGESSSIGGVVTSRETGDYHNRVVGVDTLLRATDEDTIRLQLLGSQTQYPDQIADDFDQFQGQAEDRAAFFSYRHRTRNYLARLSYVDYGEDFRADLGFIPRVDFRQLVVGGGYTWHGESDDWYSRLSVGGDWDQAENQSSNLIEREIEGWVDFQGARQSYIFLGGGARTRVFNEVSFEQQFQSIYGEFNATSDLFLSLSASYGDRVDFSFQPQVGIARQGEQLDLSPRIRYNIGRHVKLGLSHTYRVLDLDAGQLFRANLTELNFVYQINVRAFARLITQYSQVDRNRELYDSKSIAPEENDLFNQLLFSYKLNPQTALHIGYTDSRADIFDGIEADGLRQTSRTFFAKVGFAWVP